MRARNDKNSESTLEFFEPREFKRLLATRQYKKYRERLQAYLRRGYHKRQCAILRKNCPIPPLQKVIVLLYYFENNRKGYSIRKISHMLGVPKSTVYRNLKRALKTYNMWYMRREIK